MISDWKVGSVSPIVGSVIEIVGLSLQKWGCAEQPIPMSALQLQYRPTWMPGLCRAAYSSHVHHVTHDTASATDGKLVIGNRLLFFLLFWQCYLQIDYKNHDITIKTHAKGPNNGINRCLGRFLFLFFCKLSNIYRLLIFHQENNILIHLIHLIETTRKGRITWSSDRLLKAAARLAHWA